MPKRARMTACHVIRAGQGVFVEGMQNRRLRLRWFESITDRRLQRRPLTGANSVGNCRFLCG